MQRKKTKWWKITGAGYLVLLVFAAGYFAIALFIDDPGTAARITVGVLLAAPLAVAFVWDRLKKIRLFGFEIELGDVTVEIARANPELEDAIAAQQYYSGHEALLAKVNRAVEVPDKRVLEINLRSRPYWWSTRLYLQAALLADRSRVSHLVFVEGNDERRFVGMTQTERLRDAFAERMPCMQFIYQRLAAQNLSTENLIQQWVAELFDGQSEINAKTLISSSELKALLNNALQSSRLERAGRADREIYSEILKHGGRFVPLVQDGRLERIVDADRLARRLAETAV